MIRIPDTPLDLTASSELEAFQLELDAFPDYADRVTEAKKKFASRNRHKNKTFKVVRETLEAMCSGAMRCMYCEDSLADEVEHVRPKHLYPEFTFIWENYLYACGPCNSGKRSRFEVHDGTGTRQDVTRKPGDPVVPPVAGQPLLIDPRIEDPLAFLQLDLTGTFFFDPIAGLSPQDRERAEFTRDVLKLNAKPAHANARKVACGYFRTSLVAYISIKKVTPKSPELRRIKEIIQQIGQRTVWEEMKRQRARIHKLRKLFREAPEALDW